MQHVRESVFCTCDDIPTEETNHNYDLPVMKVPKPDGDDRLVLLQKNQQSNTCRSSTSIVFAPRIGRDRHGFYRGYLPLPPPHLLTITRRTDHYAPYDMRGTAPFSSKWHGTNEDGGSTSARHESGFRAFVFPRDLLRTSLWCLGTWTLPQTQNVSRMPNFHLPESSSAGILIFGEFADAKLLQARE